jgi:hypothetical protein
MRYTNITTLSNQKTSQSKDVQLNKSQISKEGLEAALALKPGRAKALGGHCECLRNKPRRLSSPTAKNTNANTHSVTAVSPTFHTATKTTKP